MFVGLRLFGRELSDGNPAQRWVRPSLILAALSAVEMGLHTLAVVDGPNLASGAATRPDGPDGRTGAERDHEAIVHGV